MNVAISASTNLLKTELAKLPDFLTLVAVGPNKAPYHANWQRNPLSKSQLEMEIDAGRCKAIGVLCGDASGGLVFVDCDGHSCDRLVEKLSGQDLAKALPKTVGITSGRPGRKQLVYRIPEAARRGLSTKKLKTSLEGEMLEFRWNGCQSVVIGHHPITDGYQYLPSQSFAECVIAEAPDWIVQQMKPSTSNWSEFFQAFELPVNEVVPLEICLSRENRELLKGADQGNRDNSGAKLARDLIGTANYLSAIAQQFTGEPQALLSEFCQNCSPPLSDKDCDRLFRSAEKSNPNPTLNPEQIEGCIKGWLWRQKKTPTHRPPRVQNSVRSVKSLSIGQLPKLIELFLTQSPSETELTSKVMDWASQTDKTEIAIWKLVNSIQNDCDRVENRKDIKQEVSRLSQIAGYQPNLRDYLNPAIAEPLNKLATWMGTTSMAMLTTLLPTAASLLPVGTELELNPGTGHVALPILYTGIVAESGSGKSPAQKTILKPLFRLQAEAEEDYAQKLSDWEADKLHAKEEGEPPPPKPKP
ncbi:MAG: bifunctional DNA primase/polymerase, partial [Cyanobacteria bacterium P01_H01_bin.15]